MLSLNDNGLPINEPLFAGTLFYVKQNKPLGLQAKHTGGW